MVQVLQVRSEGYYMVPHDRTEAFRFHGYNPSQSDGQ